MDLQNSLSSLQATSEFVPVARVDGLSIARGTVVSYIDRSSNPLVDENLVSVLPTSKYSESNITFTDVFQRPHMLPRSLSAGLRPLRPLATNTSETPLAAAAAAAAATPPADYHPLRARLPLCRWRRGV